MDHRVHTECLVLEEIRQTEERRQQERSQREAAGAGVQAGIVAHPRRPLSLEPLR